MKLHRFFLTGLVAALASSFPSPVRAQTSPDATVVLAVDGINVVRNLPVLLTERLGYFHDEGLQVTLKETSASKEIDEQLAQGAIAGIKDLHAAHNARF